MIISFINNLIKLTFNKIINTIINYFYHRNIKKYTLDYKESLIKQYINYNKLYFEIAYLPLNKILKNIIKNIQIYNLNIILYNRNKNPYILAIIENIKINFNDDIDILIDKNNDLIASVIINNIDHHIRTGYKKLSRILSFILYKQKYIIKNINCKFHNIDIHINQIKINKQSDSYKIFINKIFFKKNKETIGIITNISLTYNVKITINIDNCKIIINDNDNKIKEILFLLNKIKFKSLNEKEIDLKINIKELNVILSNINCCKINIKNINIKPYYYIEFNNLKFINFRKTILDIEEFVYNFKNNSIINKITKLYIFDSLGHKIFLLINKYIKKYNIKLPSKVTVNNLSNNIENFYIDEKISTNYTEEKFNESLIDSIEFLDDLSSSFIINKTVPVFIDNDKSSINLYNSYLKDQKHNYKLDILINKLLIYFPPYNENNINWEFKDLSYIQKPNNEITLYINNWIISKNNLILLKKNYHNDDNLLYFNFKNNNLYIFVKSVYLNLCPDSFVLMKKNIVNNIKYINKLFYTEYESNFIVNEFFIKYVSINSFILDFSYYPDQSHYYNLLCGDFDKIYKITNYTNIELKLKEISLHYPNNFDTLFSNVFTDWINDISTNQIKNILKGTNLGVTVNKLPNIYLTQSFKLIKKLLKNILYFFLK